MPLRSTSKASANRKAKQVSLGQIPCCRLALIGPPAPPVHVKVVATTTNTRGSGANEQYEYQVADECTDSPGSPTYDGETFTPTQEPENTLGAYYVWDPFASGNSTWSPVAFDMQFNYIVATLNGSPLSAEPSGAWVLTRYTTNINPDPGALACHAPPDDTWLFYSE